MYIFLNKIMDFMTKHSIGPRPFFVYFHRRDANMCLKIWTPFVSSKTERLGTPLLLYTTFDSCC